MKEPQKYRRNILQRSEMTWAFAISAATLFMLFRVPYELVFHAERMLPFEFSKWLVTLVFVVDPMYKILSSKRRGREHLNRYLSGWFILDVLAAAAAVPFILGGRSVWDMLVLLKLGPVFYTLSVIRSQILRGGNAVRFIQFAYLLTIAVHTVSCGWVYIRHSAREISSTDYLPALYWSVTTMCTVGYGDITPQTDTEMMYATFVMLTGYVFFAYLVGNIASLFNAKDPLHAEHIRTMEQTSAFLQFHSVPSTLQHRIVDYLGYMWERKVSFDETSMLGLLPWGLRSEVSLYLRREVIERIPFFRDANESLVREIADSLRPVVVTPGEFVFHIGDRARYMYFISNGAVEVLDREESYLGTLRTGDFFGEMALLQGRRRNASIRALEYTDLYVLEASHFTHILENFPEFRDVINSVAAARVAHLTELQRRAQ